MHESLHIDPPLLSFFIYLSIYLFIYLFYLFYLFKHQFLHRTKTWVLHNFFIGQVNPFMLGILCNVPPSIILSLHPFRETTCLLFQFQKTVDVTTSEFIGSLRKIPDLVHFHYLITKFNSAFFNSSVTDVPPSFRSSLLCSHRCCCMVSAQVRHKENISFPLLL